MLKLGKLPAQPGAIQFQLRTFLEAPPAAPDVFGRPQLVRSWGMLGNDTVGDCVWAGAAHETMLWTHEGAAADAQFTKTCVLSDYAAVTGYDPARPGTDRGTQVKDAASFRRRTGILDAKGRRHTIDAYLDVDPSDVPVAAWLFGALGVGLEFPGSAMSQFQARQPWTPVKGSQIEGGHYVPILGRLAGGNLLCVTWGRVQQITPAFLDAYCDESVAYLSLERLTANRSLDGFDLATLRARLAAL